jgi:hypothetical protein
MLTCKDASRLVSEDQERELGFQERLGLRLHLWMCAQCRRFERQIQLLRRALRRMAAQTDVDMQIASLTPEARERIRKAVAEQDGHSH